MNKKLTPLEVSKQLKDFVLEYTKNGLDRMVIHGSFDIIETALKRLELLDTIEKLPMPKVEVLDNNKISYVGHNIVITDKEQFDKDQKKLKALEIIKEKGNFISLEYNEYKNKYYIYDNELYMHNEITQTEFDLLKEVLL